MTETDSATDPETAEEALSMADRLRLEGAADLVLRQLAGKFGPVPEDVRRRVKRAGPSALGKWSVRVLTAATLAEVFAGSK